MEFYRFLVRLQTESGIGVRNVPEFAHFSALSTSLCTKEEKMFAFSHVLVSAVSFVENVGSPI